MATRSIIVTGCSSGIGAYCAKQLSIDGWKVVASARKQKDIDALRRDGINAFYLDYSNPDSIDRFFDEAMQCLDNRLDALFNNGAYSQVGAVEDLSVDALRQQFDANFFGWHILTQKALSVMREQGYGRIVHCSSILGIIPCRWLGAYNASKYALEGLMVSMAMELVNTDIKVSLIEPGPIVSNVAKNAMPYMLRHVDMANSHYRSDYKAQLMNLRQVSSKGRGRLPPSAVYKSLHHALNAKSPRIHYRVTALAKLAALGKRFLPSKVLYKLIVKMN